MRLIFPLAILLVIAGCGPENSNGDPDGGDPCTPTYWYLDYDGDGWGTSLVETIFACEQPESYVDNFLDCADRDARAHPEQEEFFETPILGKMSYSLERFDFNCDFKEEKEFNTSQGCHSLTPYECDNAEPGWAGSIPDCGESKDWIEGCSYYLEACNSGIITKTQACR